jgi:deoxyadenosine/deoxycytidine kinase
MSVKIISLEGNIGSGKSTFLRNLQQLHQIKKINHTIFVQEPIDEWNQIKDKNNETILSKFYKDSEKYSFSFQMMAFITRYNKLKQAYNDALKYIEEKSHLSDFQAPIIITERSLYTDKYVFAQMLYDDKKMEEINYIIYNAWFNNFAKEFPINKIVYLNTRPETCFERIKKRSRNGESNIPLQYLQNCNKYHNCMIYEKNKDLTLIDVNGNNELDETFYEKLLENTSNLILY